VYVPHHLFPLLYYITYLCTFSCSQPFSFLDVHYSISHSFHLELHICLVTSSWFVIYCSSPCHLVIIHIPWCSVALYWLQNDTLYCILESHEIKYSSALYSYPHRNNIILLDPLFNNAIIVNKSILSLLFIRIYKKKSSILGCWYKYGTHTNYYRDW